MSISVQVCQSCGKAHYPEASLCFRCGAAKFSSSTVDSAKVISTTDIVYQVGGEGKEPIWLALVQVEDGPLLIAQLASPVAPACGVALHLSGGKLIASPHVEA